MDLRLDSGTVDLIKSLLAQIPAGRARLEDAKPTLALFRDTQKTSELLDRLVASSAGLPPTLDLGMQLKKKAWHEALLSESKAWNGPLDRRWHEQLKAVQFIPKFADDLELLARLLPPNQPWTNYAIMLRDLRIRRLDAWTPGGLPDLQILQVRLTEMLQLAGATADPVVRNNSGRLSERDLKIARLVGEDDFRHLRNPEIIKRHLRKLREHFKMPTEDAMRVSLNRIRKVCEYPSSQSLHDAKRN